MTIKICLIRELYFKEKKAIQEGDRNNVFLKDVFITKYPDATRFCDIKKYLTPCTIKSGNALNTVYGYHSKMVKLLSDNYNAQNYIYSRYDFKEENKIISEDDVRALNDKFGCNIKLPPIMPGEQILYSEIRD